MRANTFIGLMLVMAAILGLCRVKYVVGDVRRDVTKLEMQLAEEQRKMHVLQAEWAHLTRPERLAELSQGHLMLVPVAAKQMQEVYTLPVRATETAVATESVATEVRYAR